MALEIIKAGIRIVIVTAVAEGIERGDGAAPSAIRLGGKGIAPGIVGIGNNLVAICVVNGNDVSLRIGAVIEDRAFHTAGIGGGEQLEHGRTAGGVIEIPQVALERIAFKDLLPVDLSALALVFVPGVAHCLLRADPVRVIAVRGQRSVFGIRPQPPSRKGKRSPPVGGGISDGVIDNAFPAHKGQQISVAAVPIGVVNALQRCKTKI